MKDVPRKEQKEIKYTSHVYHSYNTDFYDCNYWEILWLNRFLVPNKNYIHVEHFTVTFQLSPRLTTVVVVCPLLIALSFMYSPKYLSIWSTVKSLVMRSSVRLFINRHSNFLTIK